MASSPLVHWFFIISLPTSFACILLWRCPIQPCCILSLARVVSKMSSNLWEISSFSKSWEKLISSSLSSNNFTVTRLSLKDVCLALSMLECDRRSMDIPLIGSQLSPNHVYLLFQLINAYSQPVDDFVDWVLEIIEPSVVVIQWHLLGYVDSMYHVINLCSAASVWLWHGFGEIWYRSNYPKEWVTFSNKMFRSST